MHTVEHTYLQRPKLHIPLRECRRVGTGRGRNQGGGQVETPRRNDAGEVWAQHASDDARKNENRRELVDMAVLRRGRYLCRLYGRRARGVCVRQESSQEILTAFSPGLNINIFTHVQSMYISMQISAHIILLR